MPNMIVISLDFDGCLFHGKGSLSKASENTLITHNEVIVAAIQQKLSGNKLKKAVFIVGSNRQSHFVDQRNAMQGSTGSCYAAIHKIANWFASENPKLAIEVDSYLLSDTYGNHKAGDNFNHALALTRDFTYSDWFFDESKLTILYAQMHKFASEHPRTKIIYNFVEDRYFPNDNPDDILHGLHEFFKTNTDIIPKNISLALHYYDGERYLELDKIKGTGKIDHRYEDNIKLMIECAGFDYDKDRNQYNLVRQRLCEGDGLARFKKSRRTARKK